MLGSWTKTERPRRTLSSLVAGLAPSYTRTPYTGRTTTRCSDNVVLVVAVEAAE